MRLCTAWAQCIFLALACFGATPAHASESTVTLVGPVFLLDSQSTRTYVLEVCARLGYKDVQVTLIDSRTNNVGSTNYVYRLEGGTDPEGVPFVGWIGVAASDRAPEMQGWWLIKLLQDV